MSEFTVQDAAPSFLEDPPLAEPPVYEVRFWNDPDDDWLPTAEAALVEDALLASFGVEGFARAHKMLRAGMVIGIGAIMIRQRVGS